MANDFLQKLALADSMNLLSGNIDLKFPHLEKEMAQAEACKGCRRQWVNYFIHAAYLHIKV
jgi:cysteinyl-tRNA synthetase